MKSFGRLFLVFLSMSMFFGVVATFAAAPTGESLVKGPTKEQTTLFINKHFKEMGTLTSRGNLGKDILQMTVSEIAVEVKGCRLEYSYIDTFTYDFIPSKGTKISGSEWLDDVEKLEFGGEGPTGSNHKIWGIKFNKSDRSFDIPVGVFHESFSSMESLEIIKAINHLRKLCGAPEPLKFD